MTSRVRTLAWVYLQDSQKKIEMGVHVCQAFVNTSNICVLQQMRSFHGEYYVNLLGQHRDFHSRSLNSMRITVGCGFVTKWFKPSPYCSDVPGSNPCLGVLMGSVWCNKSTHFTVSSTRAIVLAISIHRHNSETFIL